MRILLFDEAFLGHHAIWMEEILRGLHDIAPHVELVYAFPYAFDVPAEHMLWRGQLTHHILRKVQAWTSRPWLAAAKWRCLVRMAKKARADRVLLLYGDEFLHPKFSPSVNFSWVPIYFHPRFLRGDPVLPPLATLRVDSCQFIYVLDAGIRASLSALVCKPVVRIPDFCPTERATRTARCDAVERAAAGRPIIGAIGPITRHKNIGTLISVAKCRPEWHFLIVGLMFAKALAPSERKLVEEARSMSNVSCIFEYLPHGELNALSSMCAVQFAAYVRFLHSSNKLVRASAYRTPLVVAELGCMGENVARFGIGQCCDPENATSVDAAIARSLAMDLTAPDWDGCLADNSFLSLRESLVPLVADGMGTTAQAINPLQKQDTLVDQEFRPIPPERLC